MCSGRHRELYQKFFGLGLCNGGDIRLDGTRTDDPVVSSTQNPNSLSNVQQIFHQQSALLGQ